MPKLLSQLAFVLAGLSLTAAAPEPGPARYAGDGALIPPPDYREWVFMSTGLDMSYTEAAPPAGGSVFDNVFVDPASWRRFKETGHWPEGALFVLEVRGGENRGSINKHGQFQTERVLAVEAHVHDSSRFKGGWGFFAFDGVNPARMIPYQAACYACHQAHGAVDTTFTQFYPTAKPLAVKAGAYREP